MIDLLLNTSVYVLLRNDFYIQLTGLSQVYKLTKSIGEPLSDVRPLHQTTCSLAGRDNLRSLHEPASTATTSRKRKIHSRIQHLPKKKQKLTSTDDRENLPKTPNAIVFARSRMFYARPARSLRGNVIFGLRKERIIP
jgi:hypothetical protein